MYAFNVRVGASEIQLVTFGEMSETSTPKPVIKGRSGMRTEFLARNLYVPAHVPGNRLHVGIKLTYRDLVFQLVSDSKFTNSVLV
jgi:phosphate-selective porin